MGDDNGQEHGRGYADTWRARQIAKVLKTAWKLANSPWRGTGRLVFIGANAGDGKDTVCDDFTAKHPDRVWHVKSDRTGGVKHAIHLVAAKFDFGVQTTHNNILSRINGRLTPRDMVIFQDAHSFHSVAAKIAFMDYCMGLSDATGCVIGVSVTLNLFTEGLADAGYADEQFWGRCADAAIITAPDKSDFPGDKNEAKYDAAKTEWDKNLDADIRKVWEFHCPEVEVSKPLFTTLSGLVRHPKGTLREVFETQRLARFDAERLNLPLNEELCKAAAVIREQRLHLIKRVMGGRS